MASPGEKLAKVLKERGIKATAFAEEVREKYKLKANYNSIKKWIDGRGFNEKNQAYAEEILKLEPGYFSAGGRSASTLGEEAPRHDSLRAYLERRSLSGQPTGADERAYLMRIQHIVAADPGEDFWTGQSLLFRQMQRAAEAPKARRQKS